ncbi:hypothetical protein RCC89_02580 [Cytophagaceae bacterium ABcell3]|nr:hypothetical protein RCC89_02580 [Cytophagaceae bacterium ABcell3]
MHLLSQDYDNNFFDQEGKLHGAHTKSRYNKLEYVHHYENGKLTEVVNYQLVLEDESPLKGIFKNGQPYEGYFVREGGEVELGITDYYEKGKLVSQYSIPITELGLNNNLLTEKTIFKNERIYEGPAYKELRLKDGNILVVAEHYSEGKVDSVTLLYGGVDYAEVLQVSFENDGYSLTPITFQENNVTSASLHVKFIDSNCGTLSLVSNGTPIVLLNFVSGPLTRNIHAKDGLVCYFIKDNCIFYQNIETQVVPDENSLNDQSFLFSVIDNLLTDIIQPISRIEKMDHTHFFTFKNIAAGFLHFKDGEPFEGTLIKPSKNSGTFTLTPYHNGQKADSSMDQTLQQIKDLLREIYGGD